MCFAYFTHCRENISRIKARHNVPNTQNCKVKISLLWYVPVGPEVTAQLNWSLPENTRNLPFAPCSPPCHSTGCSAAEWWFKSGLGGDLPEDQFSSHRGHGYTSQGCIQACESKTTEPHYNLNQVTLDIFTRRQSASAFFSLVVCILNSKPSNQGNSLCGYLHSAGRLFHTFGLIIVKKKKAQKSTLKT